MYAVMARSVARGGGRGIAQRPRVVGGHIEIRDILDLTVLADHNVVDGAPATRFAAELRNLMESAAVLRPPASRISARR